MTDGSYVLSCITLLLANTKMIHGTLAFLSIMGVLPSSPWLHFQNEGVSLEWVKVCKNRHYEELRFIKNSFGEK